MPPRTPTTEAVTRPSLSWLLRTFIDRPAVDWPLAAVVFACTIWLSLRHPEFVGRPLGWHIGWLRDLDADTRRAVYQTMTTLSGTLLGLTLTSVSILAGLMKQDLKTATGGLLTPKRQQRVSRLFFAGLRGLAMALLVSLALLVTEGGKGEGGILSQALTLTVLAFVAARVGRIIWVLSLILSSSVSPATSPSPGYPLISDDEY